jgi:prevent-host-death family protein
MVMRVLPLTEVKAKLSEVIDEIAATQERVTITRNGRPVAVLVGCDDLEAVEETLAILSDPALVKEVEAGRRAISTGDVVGPDDLKALRERLRSAADGPT